MIRNSAKLTALAAVALIGGAIGINCSKTTNPDIGEVKLALVLPDGTSISSVAYTVLSSSAATLASGTINVSDPNATISLDIVLPPSTNDTVRLTATTSTGVACTGTSSPFSVIAGQTTPVLMTLMCGTGSTPGQTGNIGITATLVQGDNCPSITSAAASPGQTSVGSSIAVSATGVDTDIGETVSYSWAPVANFAAPTAASTTYTCTGFGTQSFTLTVKDSHNPPCSTSVTMSVTCVATTGTGGTTGVAGTTGAGGTTGVAGTTGAGGTTGAAGAGDPTDSLACNTCEFNGTTAGNCFQTSATGQGSSISTFGCDGFTGANKTNCIALLGCLQGAACQTAIHAATADYGEAGLNFDDPHPCLCGNVSLSTCVGSTSWTGICAPQYVAAAAGGNLGSLFGSTDSPIGVANNLFTCDIDQPCTSAATCSVGR